MKDRQKESKKRLEHIHQAIIDIQKYVEGKNVEEFCNNELMNKAVLLQFIIIGEAIAHVENEKLVKYNYPWYKVRSFRNMIAHEYFNIKLSAVWNTVKLDLPELKEVIEKILEKEFT